MLLLQAGKLRPKLAFFLFCHCRLGRASARSSDGKSLWIIAFWLKPDKPAADRRSSGAQRGFPNRRKRSIVVVGL